MTKNFTSQPLDLVEYLANHERIFGPNKLLKAPSGNNIVTAWHLIEIPLAVQYHAQQALKDPR